MTDHEFTYTDDPHSGRILTLIVDGTHWVTVHEAYDMASRARADEREEADHRLRMRVHEINDQVANVVAAAVEQARTDLRAKVEALEKATTQAGSQPDDALFTRCGWTKTTVWLDEIFDLLDEEERDDHNA